MAMICVNGCRECDGCGKCMDEERPYVCPVCGEELAYNEKVYKAGGKAIGCQHCIDQYDAEDAL